MTRILQLALWALLCLSPAQAQTNWPYAPIAPVASAAAESSHVMKASGGVLVSASITTGASAGYLMIFDRDTAPTNGTVTPLYCVSVAATSSYSLPTPWPIAVTNGAVLAFSTTGCFTLTLSATAFLSAQVQ